eukprot:m.18991 g.18991  ORF g.18991 m.18991 type:complete len:113 (-) comp12296_c0_seq1:333-671(-)
MSATLSFVRLAGRIQRCSLTTSSVALKKKGKPAAPEKAKSAPKAAGPVDPESVTYLYDPSINPDKQGYFGRSVEYTDNSISSFHTYYDLEGTMRGERCEQPVPGIPTKDLMK